PGQCAGNPGHTRDRDGLDADVYGGLRDVWWDVDDGQRDVHALVEYQARRLRHARSVGVRSYKNDSTSASCRTCWWSPRPGHSSNGSIWTGSNPAAGAPFTSYRTVSPTYTAAEDGTPSGSSACRKISAAGLATWTRCESMIARTGTPRPSPT